MEATDPQEKAKLLARLTAEPGLCRTCLHLRLLATPRSVFVRCGLADTDPAFPKYPPLPVEACGGWSPHPLAPSPATPPVLPGRGGT